jgi:hypothetical protein
MIKNFKQFDLLKESNEIQIETAKGVLYRWMEGWKKIKDIDAQFDRFLDSEQHGKNMKGGICQQVWYYLLWNMFTAEDKKNGLIKELYEILGDIKPDAWYNLNSAFAKNLKPLVIDLFGNANAALGYLKQGNYKSAAEKIQVIIEKYVDQPGFVNMRSSIFSDSSIARFRSLLNTLNSPLVKQEIAQGAQPKQAATSAPSSGGSSPRGQKLDREKVSAAIKKNLIDTF